MPITLDQSQNPDRIANFLANPHAFKYRLKHDMGVNLDAIGGIDITGDKMSVITHPNLSKDAPVGAVTGYASDPAHFLPPQGEVISVRINPERITKIINDFLKADTVHIGEGEYQNFYPQTKVIDIEKLRQLLADEIISA